MMEKRKVAFDLELAKAGLPVRNGIGVMVEKISFDWADGEIIAQLVDDNPSAYTSHGEYIGSYNDILNLEMAPTTIIEDKEVFVGDILYSKDNGESVVVNINDYKDSLFYKDKYWEGLTWNNPQKDSNIINVPYNLMTKPEELHENDKIEVLLLNGTKNVDFCKYLNWNIACTLPSRIVSYKMVEKYTGTWQYAVALMKDGDVFYTKLANTEAESVEIANNKLFVKWLTDWINYDKSKGGE